MRYCQECFEELELEVGKTLKVTHEVNPDDAEESTCEHCHTSGHNFLYEPAHEHKFTKEEIDKAFEACRDDRCHECPLHNLGDTRSDCLIYLLNLCREIL